MRILIELYDKATPINNVITGLAMKPDLIAFIGDDSLSEPRVQRSIQRTFGQALPEVRFDWRICADASFEAACSALQDILDTYGDDQCVVDVTGGAEYLLLAVGRLYDRRAVPVVTFRPSRNRFEWLLGSGKVVPDWQPPRFSAAQTIAMSGGELLSSHRWTDLFADPALLGAVPKLFQVCRRNAADWRQFVQFFQQLDEPQDPAALYHTPLTVTSGTRSIRVPDGVLRELYAAGILLHLQLGTASCEFQLVYPALSACLADVGMILELYMYKMLTDCGLYDAVEMCGVVSWDNDDDPDNNVQNEIDLIATAGISQYLISCKTGAVDNTTLNEIAELAHRFGNGYATPVLVSLRNIRASMPALTMRADEMGIVLITGNDFEPEQLRRRLSSLAHTRK